MTIDELNRLKEARDAALFRMWGAVEFVVKEHGQRGQCAPGCLTCSLQANLLEVHRAHDALDAARSVLRREAMDGINAAARSIAP